MTFFFDFLWRKNIPAELEEAKEELDKLIEENKVLKHNLEDQTETTIQNKILLENYILNTNQDRLIEDLKITITNLQKQVDVQSDKLRELQ